MTTELTATDMKQVYHYFNPEEENFTGTVIDRDGIIAHFVNGSLHNENNPAVIYVTGVLDFYKNGLLHNEKGPAVNYPDGRTEYWLNGQQLAFTTDEQLLNYLSTLPQAKENSMITNAQDSFKQVKIYYNPEEKNFTGAVKDCCGDIGYYLNGKLHNEGKPAVVCADGSTHYYFNGFPHNAEGPATIYANGDTEYWVDGHRFDFEFDIELKDYLAKRAAHSSTIAAKTSQISKGAFQSDIEAATYEKAAVAVEAESKAAILRALEFELSAEQMVGASAMLETNVGSAILLMLTGLTLSYVPVFAEEKKVIKLAEKLRAKAMIAGNANLEMVKEILGLGVVLSEISSKLPESND